MYAGVYVHVFAYVSYYSPGKPTRWALTTMGSNDLVVGKTTSLDRLPSGITGKRAGEAR